MNMDPESRRSYFGEKLYPSIAQITGSDEASKITGMLLEMEPTELLHLLEDQAALNTKINEARGVLSEHKDEN